jgi:thioredoxin 1
VLDEISVELGQRIVIAKLNAETSPRAAEQYGVRGFPTMLIFKGGQVVAMRSGAMAKSKLKEWIVSSI